MLLVAVCVRSWNNAHHEETTYGHSVNNSYRIDIWSAELMFLNRCCGQLHGMGLSVALPQLSLPNRIMLQESFQYHRCREGVDKLFGNADTI